MAENTLKQIAFRPGFFGASFRIYEDLEASPANAFPTPNPRRFRAVEVLPNYNGVESLGGDSPKPSGMRIGGRWRAAFNPDGIRYVSTLRTLRGAKRLAGITWKLDDERNKTS